MRGLVIFLIILVVIASFGLIVNSTDINKNIEKSKIKEAKFLEFSTYTSAVCENKGELVHCKDEFFVNCNGEISKVFDVAECNGIKLNVPKPTGFAVFGKDWKDPRV